MVEGTLPEDLKLLICMDYINRLDLNWRKRLNTRVLFATVSCLVSPTSRAVIADVVDRHKNEETRRTQDHPPRRSIATGVDRSANYFLTSTLLQCRSATE